MTSPPNTRFRCDRCPNRVGFRSDTTSALLDLRVRLPAEEHSRCRVSLATTDTRIPRACGCAGRGCGFEVRAGLCRSVWVFFVLCRPAFLSAGHTFFIDPRIKPSTARCFAPWKSFGRSVANTKPCGDDDEAFVAARTSRRTTPRNTRIPTGKMAMVRPRSERSHRVSTAAARAAPTARLPPFDRRGVPDCATKGAYAVDEVRTIASRAPLAPTLTASLLSLATRSRRRRSTS